MENKRLLSIEIIRFAAAFSVLLHHIPSIDIGVFGVDAFFIISGFVMMYSTKNFDKNFFLKRLLRIIPLYWSATFGVYLISLYKPEILYSSTSDINHLLNSLFFIPFDKNGVGHEPLLAVGWTLNLEVLFYLIFYLSLIISNKYRDIIATLIICSSILIFNNFDFFITNVYSDIILIEFILGFLIYNLLYDKKSYKNFFIIIIIVFVILIKNTYLHRFFYFGIPMAILCFLVIKYLKIKYSNLIINLGGMSYALYISHVFIIRIFDRLLPWFGSQNNINNITATLFSIFGSTLVGFFIYKFLDMPLYRKLRSFL